MTAHEELRRMMSSAGPEAAGVLALYQSPALDLLIRAILEDFYPRALEGSVPTGMTWHEFVAERYAYAAGAKEALARVLSRDYLAAVIGTRELGERGLGPASYGAQDLLARSGNRV